MSQGQDAKPEPLVPAEVDLRDFPRLTFDVTDLCNGDLGQLADDGAFRAAVVLRAVAWHQRPAGSLPLDDAALCRLAGLGRDLDTWHRMKAGALMGWVLCADGRLYHPALAEAVIAAWVTKQRHRERRKGDAERLRRWREERRRGSGDCSGQVEADERDTGAKLTEHAPGNSRETRFGTRDDTRTKRVGEGEREGKGESPSSLRSDGAPAPPPPVVVQPRDARDALWHEGPPRLVRLTGLPDDKARRLLGRLLRECRDDCALLALILAEAEASRPIDPIPWLQASITQRTGQRAQSRSPLDDGWDEVGREARMGAASMRNGEPVRRTERLPEISA